MKALTFKMTLKLTDNTLDLGAGPGVLVTAEAHFPTATEEDLLNGLFLVSLDETAELFMHNNVHVEVERI